MLLRMSVSQSTAFAEATLCAGDVAVTIPARNAATSHDFAITHSSVTATPPWTNGVAVGVGIVRSPATCASITTGIVWQAAMTPGSDSSSPGLTGYSTDTSSYGSLSPGATFTEGGSTFTVDRLRHSDADNAIALALSINPATTFADMTLCAGDLSLTISGRTTPAGSLGITIGHITTPPWTIGTPVTVGFVRAPSTCASLAPPLPTGVVWQAEITPANNPVSNSNTNGWSQGAYGSINGTRTFTEGGVTFTVDSVVHNRAAAFVQFLIKRSSSTGFAASTLCAGDLSLPVLGAPIGVGDIALLSSGSPITSTPPWTIGMPVTVGIVRAPATCATLTTAVTLPTRVGTMPNLNLQLGGSQQINVAPYFSGTSPTYSAISSNPSVTGVGVVGSTLTVQNLAAGTVTVTVTATNSAGSIDQSFSVTATGGPPPPPPPPPESTSRPSQPPPDPPNFARNQVQWSSEGGMQPLPVSIREISANKPSGASGSVDLSTIAASVREQFQSHSRGYYLTTRVFGLDEGSSLVRRAPGGSRWIADGDGQRYEVVARSSLLLVKIWHIYYHPGRGHNTIELLGDTFLPRRDNRLTEAVEICLPAPSRNADRVRLAVKGRLDPHWTVLETTVEDGMVCADTVRVAWLAMALAPEDEAS